MNMNVETIDLEKLIENQNALLRAAASAVQNLRTLRAQKADIEARIKTAEDECDKASRLAINATQQALKGYAK